MSLWRQLTHGLRGLTHRSAAARDLADEVRHYFEQAIAAHEARGLSRDEAVRAARRELGSASAVHDEVRAYGWEHVVDSVVADFRYAVRRLLGAPGFSTVTVLTLAIGIGATTAIFGAVDPILFQPLPYTEPGRIVMVSDYGPDGERFDVTFGTYRELATRSRSFSALAVMRGWQPTFSGLAEPERLDGQRVSAKYFQTLGVAPQLGHDFDAGDDRIGGPHVVIVSDALWRRRLGADPTIVGRPVRLNGDSYVVIGVMPKTFENVLAPSAEVWSLLQYNASLPSIQGVEWGHHLIMVGRLRQGVAADQARRELQRIARTPVPELTRPAWASLSDGLMLHPLRDDITAAVRPALLAILGGVVLVLLIACVNVTNLLLARGVQRRGELAMRTALGAGRLRLMRQLLTESLVLALVGGVLGLLLAQIGVRALVALSPPELPRVNAIRLSGGVFVFALGLTTLSGMAVGLIPALQARGRDMHTALQRSSRRSAGGGRNTRGVLVVAEVALAFMLLVGAGLLLRSLERLFAISPGFDASRLLTMQVQVAGPQYRDDVARYRFFTQALDAVRRVPGVTAAAFTSQLPLSGDIDGYGAHLESSPSDNPEGDRNAMRYAVTPGYTDAMGIPLRRGRLLDDHDVAGRPKVVMVSALFARRNYPGIDPIGQRLRFGPDTAWATVVGVVGDVKQTSLAVSEVDAVYMTPAQWAWVDSRFSLVVRTRESEGALTPAIKAAIWSVDKDQPIARVITMDGLVAASAASRRFALVVFEAFGVVALVLAAIGLYGVLSGSVTERVREIGVRSALGASQAQLLRLIMRQGLTLTGLGVAIGVSGAALASHAIVTLLYGVSRLDPVTYLGVLALLAGVSVVATSVPAYRASRVDPATTMRAE